MGWFKRHAATTAHPTVVVTEGSAGTLNFKNQGIKTNEKTISLGEEHSETLPNGEMVRVSDFQTIWYLARKFKEKLDF